MEFYIVTVSYHIIRRVALFNLRADADEFAQEQNEKFDSVGIGAKADVIVVDADNALNEMNRIEYV